MARRRNDEEDMEEVSLRSKDRSEGGGLAGRDGIEATISKARYVEYDYEGKVDPPVTVARLDFTSEVEGFESFKEVYTVGKGLVPSSDGLRLMKKTKDATFNSGTKWAKFMDSCEAEGVEEDMFQPIDQIEGLTGVFKRAADERKGLDDSDGKKKDRTILLLEELGSLPGEGKKSKTKAKSKKAAEADEDEDDEDEDEKPTKRAAKKKPAKGDDDDEDEEADEDDEDEDADEDEDEKPAKSAKSGKAVDPAKLAVATVSALLDDKKYKKGINIEDDLAKAVYRALSGNDARKDVIALISDDDDLAAFLKKNAKVGEWSVEDGVLTRA